MYAALKQHCPIYVATTAVNNTCIYINTSIPSLISVYTGQLDPQTKAWMGHCTCVVEHSIGQPNQKAVLNIINMQSMLLLGGFGACTTRKNFKNTCSQIKSEGTLQNK